MYCHAMATLALCEGYALTGDAGLRDLPLGRSLSSSVPGRETGWPGGTRPGEGVGDTSILGWVVMGLKSARVAGIPIPDDASVRRGARLARQRLVRPVRRVGQLPGRRGCHADHDRRSVGLPPVPRCEAARGPRATRRPIPYSATCPTAARPISTTGTTPRWGLFQHGGEPWTRWSQMRDRIVATPPARGHRRKLGSRREPLRIQGRPDSARPWPP